MQVLPERIKVPDKREAPMGYKTILVHCNDRQRLPRLLAPAVALCSTFGAHLVGVSVTPPIAVIAAGMPGAPDVIVLDEHAKAYQAENPAMKATFEKAAYAQNVTAEWREEDADSSTVVRTMMRHARTADLIIASQSAADRRGSFDVDIPDRLAFECGRPVLIIPNTGSQQAIPKRIVIGWADRREATRAVFDALPLLRRADKVAVVEVDPEPGQAAIENRVAICAALSRDGVTCEPETATSRHGNVGDALLAFCESTRADLLVMGCYGHSRLREFMLGGATRHLLASMSLPVLMSH
jgi:nucleotide-binding universal stress UspA family protein